MKDSYKNPFSAVNAVQLSPKSILQYWCSPFPYEFFSELREGDIFTEEMNIVFSGGRSTGKSMFLRYWSHEIQALKAKERDCKFLDLIREMEGIGIYVRIDGSVIESFRTRILPDDDWEAIFTHYLELFVGRQYIEILKILQEEGSISADHLSQTFFDKITTLLGFPRLYNLVAILDEFDDLLVEVDQFRGNVPFFKKPFEPRRRGYAGETISFDLGEAILKHFDVLEGINFAILLDEYENFYTYQQRVVNGLLKFSRPNIKFRIGMRPEGFKTYSIASQENFRGRLKPESSSIRERTQDSSEDFIKEGREYRLVIFEDILSKENGYHNFLVDIAKRRLELIPALREKGFTNIKHFLSDKEDLETEALDIARKAPERIGEYFIKTFNVPKRDIEVIRYPENPLLELLNCVWLIRNVPAERVRAAMLDYLAKGPTKDGKKYRMDYVNKYKLSLTFLLCKIFHKKKKYYSFNTFAFLSSGVIGHFLSLCRESFVQGEWNNKTDLLEKGKISYGAQAVASAKVSDTEQRQIGRIRDYGGDISRFVANLGFVFEWYHDDFRLRYPETNQFAMNVDTLDSHDLREAVRAAIRWSVIQKKPRSQRVAPNEHVGNLYTLNRIFSPIFQISYRTRGGVSVPVNETRLYELLNSEKIDINHFVPKENSITRAELEKTPALFPNLYE